MIRPADEPAPLGHLRDRAFDARVAEMTGRTVRKLDADREQFKNARERRERRHLERKARKGFSCACQICAQVSKQVSVHGATVDLEARHRQALDPSTGQSRQEAVVMQRDDHSARIDEGADSL